MIDCDPDRVVYISTVREKHPNHRPLLADILPHRYCRQYCSDFNSDRFWPLSPTFFSTSPRAYDFTFRRPFSLILSLERPARIYLQMVQSACQSWPSTTSAFVDVIKLPRHTNKHMQDGHHRTEDWQCFAEYMDENTRPEKYASGERAFCYCEGWSTLACFLKSPPNSSSLMQLQSSKNNNSIVLNDQWQTARQLRHVHLAKELEGQC